MNGFANIQPFMWESLRLLDRGVVQPQKLFSHEFRLGEIDKAFLAFHTKADDAMKMLIRP